MSFITAGNTCLLQLTPICPSHFSSQSVHFPSLYLKNAKNKNAKKNNSVSFASLRRQEDNIFCKRKAIFLLGISVFPFLHPKTRAFQSLAADENKLIATKENEKEETKIQKVTSSNPVVSFLNKIGILGLSAITALYASIQNNNKASQATIESMETKLKEREEEIVLLEKNFELKLQYEHDVWNRQLKIAKEEQKFLRHELYLANSEVTRLSRELNNEKMSVHGLENEIDSLYVELQCSEQEVRKVEEYMKMKLTSMTSLENRLKLLSSEVRDNENTIQELTSSVSDREVELRNLSSTYRQIIGEQKDANLEIQRLKDEPVNCENELVSKDALMDELNSRVNSLIVERDGFKKHLDAVQEEHDVLQTSSEEKAALGAKLLKKREIELTEMKEKHEFMLHALSRDQQTVCDLTQERDGLKKLLSSEIINVENLRHELEITRENFVKSTNEASDLAKELKQSRIVSTELESEISRIKKDYAEAEDSLQRSIHEVKLGSEEVASELTTANERLKKTMDDLQTVSHELSAVTADREGLQKELVDVYKRLESAESDTKEQKKVTSSLNEKVEALEKQNLNVTEARKSLESGLEEATKALNEMNKNALSLSREVEKAHYQISILEDEKEVLYKSLSEERSLSKEARKNMEDAHNLVMRLGKERDTLASKAKKFEEELASAKGEILLLRSHINSVKTNVNNMRKETDEAEGKVIVTAKKNTRRRKAKSQ